MLTMVYVAEVLLVSTHLNVMLVEVVSEFTIRRLLTPLQLITIGVIPS